MTDARWRIFPDASALAEAAAETIVAAIEAGGDVPAICLTGGSTPRRVYDLLGRDPWVSRIPWQRVHWFVGDERFAPTSDERSNMGEVRRLLLDRCAPMENIHGVRTDVTDVHAAAQLYDAELRSFMAARGADTLFDLVLLGVGPDGHVASLFPGSAAARGQSRWAAGVDHAALAPFVPRVTLTFDALSSCRDLLFMAEGAGKAEVLLRIAQGDELPATRVTSQQGAVWLVDEAAAPPADVLGPRIILVMGVSGSGKTTIGGALAARLGWSFLDADDLHSDAMKAKMHSGAPLTDLDRAPWLQSVRDDLARRKSEGADVVVACSALKRRYRNVIVPAFARSRNVHLRGASALIAARLEKRKGHYMPSALLGDQLSVLEDPAEDEHALVVDVESPAPTQVGFIAARLQRFINTGRL
ncbi:MAG: gluconate kinase [Hyphomicrobiales bacterium]|nr:gluconate kinase [Hyphomicrobiales bacterium]